MPVSLPSPLVSADWLSSHLSQVKVVDASWHMPAAQRNAAADFEAAHIAGAVFFDIDAHSDHSSGLPHTLPSTEHFAKTMAALGINNSDCIVVYDTAGLFSAARLWWMLRVFGHKNVAVLDGGLPAWKAANLPLESGAAQPKPAAFHATLHPALLRGKADILANLTSAEALVLDARAAERYAGTLAEPRAGLRSGHIPASHNLHFGQLLQADGCMKPAAELATLLAPAQGKPVISSCGSGITACIIDLALEITGHRQHAVYDGSWAEWGADAACPIETGENA